MSFHPDDDWCTTHGTRDAGLAAATTNNTIGVAGVCGNCKLLEINISTSAAACNCAQGNDPDCGIPDVNYYQKVENAANLSLASDDTLLVVNMPFIIGYGTSSDPTEVASLWNVHARGIALTAASGNGGQGTTTTAAPANIPFVLGVGGSTWEGRFWDKSTSCYHPDSVGGTTVGYGEFFGTDPTARTGRFIDVCAPASGFIATTESLENTTDSGLYWLTSSRCSGASSQVAGAIGLIQSAYKSRTGRYMSADDAIGIIEATAVPFRIDPADEPGRTCTYCPREQYGRGILDLGYAAWLASDAIFFWDDPQWRRVASKTQNNGLWRWEQVAEFTITGGTNAGTWVQYRATAGIDLGNVPGAPVGGGRSSIIGWARRFTTETTSFAAYPLQGERRIMLALMGVRDCQMRLIAPDGTAEIVGYAYARRLEGGGLSWLGGIDENTIQMAYHSPDRLLTGVDPDALRGPRELLELRVFSAPGGHGWRIAWRQSSEAGARLVIHNVAGRLVVSKDLGSGGTARRFEWDGRSNSGTRVPSGIYWVGIEADGQRSTKKCLLIR